MRQGVIVGAGSSHVLLIRIGPGRIASKPPRKLRMEVRTTSGGEPVSPRPFNQSGTQESRQPPPRDCQSADETKSRPSTLGRRDRFVRTELVIGDVEALLVVLWRADKNFHESQRKMGWLATFVRAGVGREGAKCARIG